VQAHRQQAHRQQAYTGVARAAAPGGCAAEKAEADPFAAAAAAGGGGGGSRGGDFPDSAIGNFAEDSWGAAC